MTNHTDRAALVATVERLGAELQQARQDVALFQRLKASEADAKRLALDLRAAQDELTEALTADHQAEQDARFAGFLDITVREHMPFNGSGVLQLAFSITVKREAFNGYETVPEVLSFGGFQQLPSDAFGYLIEKHPERIPESIMELAPGDPYAAFDRYFNALRRGFLAVRSAA